MIPQTSTASFYSYDQKLFQRKAEICNCKAISFCTPNSPFSVSVATIFETKQKRHSSSQKETTTWNTTLGSRWGNTKQEIPQEANPNLDTEASSFMLCFNRNCLNSQNLVLKLHYKISKQHLVMYIPLQKEILYICLRNTHHSTGQQSTGNEQTQVNLKAKYLWKILLYYCSSNSISVSLQTTSFVLLAPKHYPSLSCLLDDYSVEYVFHRKRWQEQEISCSENLQYRRVQPGAHCVRK